MTILTKLMTGAAVAALLTGPAIAESHVAADGTTEETMAEDGAATGDGAMEGTVLDEDATAGDGTLAPADGSMAADGTATDTVADEMGFASLEEMTVGDLLGMAVFSPDDERIGEIDYVVVPAAGPQGVIGIGGFLGLGEYTVAIPLEDFQLREDGTSLLLGTDKEALKELPEFDDSGVEGLPDETPLSSIMQASAEGETDMSTEAPAEDGAAMDAESDADAEMEADADTDVGADAEADVDADAEAEVETEESN